MKVTLTEELFDSVEDKALKTNPYYYAYQPDVNNSLEYMLDDLDADEVMEPVSKLEPEEVGASSIIIDAIISGWANILQYQGIISQLKGDDCPEALSIMDSVIKDQNKIIGKLQKALDVYQGNEIAIDEGSDEAALMVNESYSDYTDTESDDEDDYEESDDIDENDVRPVKVSNEKNEEYSENLSNAKSFNALFEGMLEATPDTKTVSKDKKGSTLPVDDLSLVMNKLYEE